MKSDYVDIRKTHSDELERRLTKLWESDYMKACNYCRVLSEKPTIPPGEQLRELPSIELGICERLIPALKRKKLIDFVAK